MNLSHRTDPGAPAASPKSWRIAGAAAVLVVAFYGVVLFVFEPEEVPGVHQSCP